MIDGRGLHMVERKAETKKRIEDYIKLNPNALKKDVCKAVGVTPVTLRTHLREINAGK